MADLPSWQFPSSPWASALDRYMVSALGSRVGSTPARKGRTVEHMADLPLWPSGQPTRPPCAVERDALSDRGWPQPRRIRLPKNYL